MTRAKPVVSTTVRPSAVGSPTASRAPGTGAIRPPPTSNAVRTATPLPTDLGRALDALEGDGQLTDALGKPFADAFLAFERDELARFQRYVTDWEFREYARLI
ncbi:hypothetical protein [Streptomyces sp. Inha503]|uniref:hypothetical protein n=1 Tax=Streptomyces sp. Inha503 TaxID=3383314 RepID=UPI0039A3000F